MKDQDQGVCATCQHGLVTEVARGKRTTYCTLLQGEMPTITSCSKHVGVGEQVGASVSKIAEFIRANFYKEIDPAEPLKGAIMVLLGLLRRRNEQVDQIVAFLDKLSIGEEGEPWNVRLLRHLREDVEKEVKSNV